MEKPNMGHLTKKPIDHRKYRKMQQAWLLDKMAKLGDEPEEGVPTLLAFYGHQLRTLAEEDRLEMLEERVEKLEKRVFGR